MIKVLNIKKQVVQNLFIFLITSNLYSQSSLDRYLDFGLKNNLVLQQKNISLDIAINALKKANRLFLPSIDFSGGYQSGDGGRSISIPVGDMLNPVYNALNQLTSSDQFPQISNVETNFFPQNFYDLKIRTSMPIINSDLIYNRSIQKQQTIIQEYEIEIYKTELTKDIQVAYFNYLSSAKSVLVYDGALTLAQEAKRINQSLLDNGKSIKAYVLRSESEIQNLEAKKATVLKQMNNARFYFNFLINADPEQDIDTIEVISVDQKTVDYYLLTEVSIDDRTELKALEQSASIYKTALKMNKAYWYPRLNGFLDLGSQNTDWKFNDKSRYYFLGLQLEFPLFSAGKNRLKVKQSELELNNLLIGNSNAQKQLKLSANMAHNSLKAAYMNYAASIKQLDAAVAYNRMIDKGYSEGINTFIETIDAINQVTAASLQHVITKYHLLAAIATYQREISK